MQSRLWRLHPSSTLPASISCLTSPTYFTSTRFGVPIGPIFTRPVTASSPNRSAAAMDIITISDEDLDDMELVDPPHYSKAIRDYYELESGSSPTSQKPNHFVMDAFTIPLQPRKAPQVTATKVSKGQPVETGRFVSIHGTEDYNGVCII